MDELIVWRSREYHNSFNVLRLVVENHDPEPHLLALAALVGALHLYEERQHAYILQGNYILQIYYTQDGACKYNKIFLTLFSCPYPKLLGVGGFFFHTYYSTYTHTLS